MVGFLQGQDENLRKRHDTPQAQHFHGEIYARKVSPGRLGPGRCRSLGRWRSYTDNVDTVPVSLKIGKIVAQVCAIHADSFAVGQHEHVFRKDLLVAEAWPPMMLRLHVEIGPRSSDGSTEERQPGDDVVESDGLAGIQGLGEGRGEPIARIFGPAMIIAADVVGRTSISTPAQWHGSSTWFGRAEAECLVCRRLVYDLRSARKRR